MFFDYIYEAKRNITTIYSKRFIPSISGRCVRKRWLDDYIRKKHLGTKLEIDLGLEKVITAEKGVEKIAVEVKSFLEDSLIHEFHAVVGQYLHYIIGLSIIDVERILYLAMPHDVYLDLQKIELFNLSVEKFSVKILTFDTQIANIILWKK